MSSSSAPVQVIRFGLFEADLRSGELRKSGIKIKLHDQPFQILAMLLERSGELVTRKEIRKRLWPGETFVDFDHGLNNAVNRLREALGDSAENPRFIETLPRRGYRFIGTTNGAKEIPATDLASENVSSGNVSEEKPNRETGEAKRTSYTVLLSVSLVVLVVALLVVLQFRKGPPPPSSRTFVLPPEGATFNLIGDDGGSVALSPDGTRLAFVAVDSTGTRLIWVRTLGKLNPDPIDGSEGASFPFWSPDGRSIGYFSQGKLKRIGSDGRISSKIICDAPFGRGGSWNSQGVIIFAPESHSGIYRVADSGGTPVPITTVDSSKHTSHRWPRFMPDGKHFIYLAVSHFIPANHNGVYLGSLDGNESKWIVSTDADATYASGYLFFARKDVFMAQRFDPEKGQLRGEPQHTSEKVLYDPMIWKAVFDASEKGVMAYQLGDRVRGNQFFWFNRRGEKLGALGEPSFQWEPSISPDGRRLAVGVAEGGYSNLWVYDLHRGGRMQITFSRYDNGTPVWLRDGSGVVFSAKRQHYSLYQVDSDGTEPEHLLFDSGRGTWPLDLSPDGQFLLYGEGVNIGRVQSELLVYPMRGEGRPFRLLKGNASTGSAQFSPDGHWVAYNSGESGRDEVYVVPFETPPTTTRPRSSAVGGKWQVSISGGRYPRWRRDGREMYYLAFDDKIMVVPVVMRGSKLEIGTARPLFRANPGFYNVSYDVSPDGSRFIINTAAEEKTAPVTIVENWLSDFRN